MLVRAHRYLQVLPSRSRAIISVWLFWWFRAGSDARRMWWLLLVGHRHLPTWAGTMPFRGSDWLDSPLAPSVAQWAGQSY